MSLIGIDHLQVAMPAGAEAAVRAFYGGVLGLSEMAKPVDLAARGGVWFRLGSIELHVGVDAAFRPATKAHPGFLVDDLDGLCARLNAAGHVAKPDRDPRGRRRLYLEDPFGNRLELIELTNGS